MRSQWGEIEALDNKVAADVQLRLLLEGRRLVERGSRWLLAHRGAAARHRRDRAASSRPGATALQKALPRLLGAVGRRAADGARPTSCEQAGVPPGLAHRVAGLATMFSTFDIVEVADARPASTSRRSRRCTSGSASASSCTGCATASWRSRATTAGARWPGPRCATTSTASTAASRPRCCATPRPTAAAAERVDAWVAAQPGVRALLQTLAEIRVGHVFDTTTLPVAVREVRNLLLASASRPSAGLRRRSARRRGRAPWPPRPRGPWAARS